MKKALGTLALSASLICMSHALQIYNINRESFLLRQNYSKTLRSPEEDLGDIVTDLNKYNPKKDWDFILGDFEIENGKARCGGIAAEASRKLSERGFRTRIVLTVGGVGLHYYTEATKNGKTYRVEQGGYSVIE